MIAGHAPLAFALAASLAVACRLSRGRALAIGLAAGAFALVPDVDVAYAIVGAVDATPTGVWSATEAFWRSSRTVHRGITHSLLLALPAVGAFGLAAADRPVRLGAVPLLGGLLALAFAGGGPLGLATTVLYLLGGLAVVTAARQYGIGARSVGGAAAVGLITHPFGDLFTGTPPRVLYPLGVDLFPRRIDLLADPTLNLLAVFGLELAAIWLGVLVAASLLDTTVRNSLDRRAFAGVGYGVMVLFLPAPTLGVSYHFVFSVVSVGVVGAAPLVRRVDAETIARGFVTGLAAVSLGGLAYAIGYVVV